jgi:peptide/nickel transport system substrate-binding protein
MTQLRLRRLPLFVLSLFVVPAGCGRDGDRADEEPSTITVLYYGDERIVSPNWNSTAAHLVFLPLATNDANGDLEGRLARSWEHSPDYVTWTVHLRTDVRWHDGVPVTAHDVKFSMDLLSDPDVHDMPRAFSITVLDDSTYTITYRKKAGGNPEDDYTVYYPKHLLEGLDPKEFAQWEFWIRPVGNGPYRYVRHVPKTMLELEANPDYFRGAPRIERVVLKFAESPLTELLSGNVDVAQYVDRTDLLKLAGDPRFRTYESFVPANTKAILWNQHHPPFRDPDVRRALTLAIDRRELLQVVNMPAETPIFDVIFSGRQFGRGQIPAPLPYDPEQASQLLEAAGWRDSDGDGVRDRDGLPFRFTALVTTGQGLEPAAVFIQAQLRRAGIKMDLQVLDLEAAEQRTKAGDFEAAIMFFFMGSSSAERPGPLMLFGNESPIGYVNPRVAALLEQVQTSMNPDEIDGLYSKLMPTFQADLPVTFLYPSVFTTVAHRRVHGLSSPDRTEAVMHMEELWLEDAD